MKFIEFYAGLKKIMKFLEFNARIRKQMKFIEFHARIMKKPPQKIIPHQIHENHEIHRTQFHNY